MQGTDMGSYSAHFSGSRKNQHCLECNRNNYLYPAGSFTYQACKGRHLFLNNTSEDFKSSDDLTFTDYNKQAHTSDSLLPSRC